MTLWLIGMMGSGKSTVGPRLASRLEVPFIDTDTEIETASAKSITRIWAEDGESVFRETERQVIAWITGMRVVVATGGGAPIDQVNRERMRAGGKVVWLDADAEEIASRIGEGADRPILAGEDDTRAAVARLLAVRRPFYEASADLTIRAGGLDTDAIAGQIASWYLAGHSDD